MPFRGLDVAFHFFRVSSTIDVYVRNARHGEKFECVFD